MCASIRRIVFLLLALSAAPLSRVAVRAEEAANDADDYYNDDQMQEQADDDDYVGGEQEAAWDSYQWQGDDYIQYWTEFAIYPKRCIV